jgi:hypothetical protein
MTQITSPVERSVVVGRDQVNRVPVVGARGQLTTTSNTTVYTAPTLVEHPNDPLATSIASVIMTSLVLTNTDTVARVVSAHLVESGGSVAANRAILSALSIAASTMTVVEFGDKGCPMASGEFLNLISTTANVITYRVNVELLPQ